jgi:ABC-type molybdate transport system substrate-binding protein
MESQYFKWKGWQDDDNWDFSRYTPTAVVVMLGANDENIVGQDLNRFQASYSKFLNRIRSDFPKAHLFVLSEPLGALYGPTQAAVRKLTDAGDKNVYFVDSTGWVQYGKAFHDEVSYRVSNYLVMSCTNI